MTTSDPFSWFKDIQREAWAMFEPLETLTTPAAAHLVNFARIAKDEKVLDVACGTGVVSITAARVGALVKGLDLAPGLLRKARLNSTIAELEIVFTEGDVESLPFEDSSFDVVVSQFGHMFAPRPQVAISEMLRVVRQGGRIAFSTWPPELFTGQMFSLNSRYFPLPDSIPPPTQWGEPNFIRERLGNSVKELTFERERLLTPALSPQHFRTMMESASASLSKWIPKVKEEDPALLAKFRKEYDALVQKFMTGNTVKQDFLMARAVKT